MADNETEEFVNNNNNNNNNNIDDSDIDDSEIISKDDEKKFINTPSNPSIIIGVGDAGIKSMKALHKLISNVDELDYYKFAAVDSNPQELEKNCPADIDTKIILSSPIERMDVDKINYNYLHDGIKFNLDGALRQRRFARYLLDNVNNYNRTYRTLQDLITNFHTYLMDTQQSASRINVWFLHSLSGGTGSGTFVLLAAMLSQIADKFYNVSVHVNGVGCLPSIMNFENQDQGPEQRTYYANTYTALNELKSLMKLDNSESIKIPVESLRMQGSPNPYIELNHCPFNKYFLVGIDEDKISDVQSKWIANYIDDKNDMIATCIYNWNRIPSQDNLVGIGNYLLGVFGERQVAVSYNELERYVELKEMHEKCKNSKERSENNLDFLEENLENLKTKPDPLIKKIDDLWEQYFNRHYDDDDDLREQYFNRQDDDEEKRKKIKHDLHEKLKSKIQECQSKVNEKNESKWNILAKIRGSQNKKTNDEIEEYKAHIKELDGAWEESEKREKDIKDNEKQIEEAKAKITQLENIKIPKIETRMNSLYSILTNKRRPFKRVGYIPISDIHKLKKNIVKPEDLHSLQHLINSGYINEKDVTRGIKKQIERAYMWADLRNQVSKQSESVMTPQNKMSLFAVRYMDDNGGLISNLGADAFSYTGGLKRTISSNDPFSIDISYYQLGLHLDEIAEYNELEIAYKNGYLAKMIELNPENVAEMYGYPELCQDDPNVVKHLNSIADNYKPEENEFSDEFESDSLIPESDEDEFF